MEAMYPTARVYGAYGQRRVPPGDAQAAYTGAIGEREAAGYLLDDRLYVPTLRRFVNPDSFSPFEEGGLNRYAYCGGDPIGRIDPNGHSWLDWLGTMIDSLDLRLTRVSAADGVEHAFATPGLAAVRTTPTAEALALQGALASLDDNAVAAALAAYGRSKIALPGASVATAFVPSAGALAFVWPYKGNTLSATIFTTDRRTIHVLQGPQAFHADPRRSALAAKGKGKVYPHWVKHTNASGGVHVATTTPVNLAHLDKLKRYIDTTEPGRPVRILAGAHGTPHGQNWTSTGQRDFTSEAFFTSARDKVRQIGWAAEMWRYADVDAKSMEALLNHGSGVYVHLTCFGAADAVYLRAFNVHDVTVRTPAPFDTPGVRT